MLFKTCFALMLAVVALSEDAPAEPIVNDDASKESSDDTQKLISQLTIAMSAEVVDEQTFAIRDASKAGSQHIYLRIGNTGSPPRGSLDDGEYAEKQRIAKAALGKLVEKQMIWYRAAPDAAQSANSSGPPVILADVWTTDGKHIGNFLKKEGHLADEQAYETELAKDILTVAAEEEKKESYKKLEEALKESEKFKQEAARAARAQAEEEETAEIESFGLSGWAGVVMVSVIVIGAATNFGRPSNKKVNLNRKRGAFERFWMKLKGA
jgi:endonuclease YncB( thermonuclease family)